MWCIKASSSYTGETHTHERQPNVEKVIVYLPGEMENKIGPGGMVSISVCGLRFDQDAYEASLLSYELLVARPSLLNLSIEILP